MNKYLHQYLPIAFSLLVALLIGIAQITAQKTINLQFDCKEICGNGLDDDNDGYIDCEDIDCFDPTDGFNEATARSRTGCEDLTCRFDNVSFATQAAMATKDRLTDPTGLGGIIDFYLQCSSTEWASYKNKGIIPECFWKEGTTNSALTSGMIDGVYAEVKGIIDFIADGEQNITNFSAVLLQIAVALDRDKYGCDDANRLCNIANLVEELNEEIACILPCEDIQATENQVFKLQNILDGCDLEKEMMDAYTNLSDFLANQEKINELTAQLQSTIDEILAKIETGDTETAYQAGMIMGIIGLNFVPASKVTKIDILTDMLKRLQNLTPKQVSTLIAYIDDLIRGTIKLPEDAKYAFDGDDLVIFTGNCTIGGFRSGGSASRSACKKLAIKKDGKLFLKEGDAIELFYPDGITNLKKADLGGSCQVGTLCFSAKEVSEKALKVNLKEIGDLKHGTSGRSIDDLITDIKNAEVGDPSGDLTENLTDIIFSKNSYEKLPTKIEGNKGFDGVYVKYAADGSIEDIILAEAKSFEGSIGLRPNSRDGHDQMSSDWIKAVLDAMENTGGQQGQTAQLMLDFIEDNPIKKVVTAVDKKSGEFNILNFGTHP